MDLSKRAREIISQIKYITIATVSPDGQPWNSPVYSAFDNDCNFYWNSWIENEHSKNISHNNKIFIVIYDSTVPEGTGEGVYIKATVEMVTEENEMKKALEILRNRKDKPSAKLRSPHEFQGSYPRRIYKATPREVWMNTDGDVDGNYVDKRVKVKL